MNTTCDNDDDNSNNSSDDSQNDDDDDVKLQVLTAFAGDGEVGTCATASMSFQAVCFEHLCRVCDAAYLTVEQCNIVDT